MDPPLPGLTPMSCITIRFVFSTGPSADSPNGEPHKRKRLTVGDVFNTDEEEIASAKRRKLIPLEYSEEEKASVLPAVKPTSAEEKRKCIKNLIERIPTAKEELFAYKLDWTMVDSVWMILFPILSLSVCLCLPLCVCLSLSLCTGLWLTPY